ncbi:hypothetical protein LTR62_005641 [Meristemomyces frigidus]|uniref:Dol-P-Glc:Glc(2)Man(9)GlcNAc(2)-PP-Dol alpha-1,2-glucosyltransferase n=1 Tax=Meristemomyces frigidus TaxID=1508187 RepID=A0AAN7TDL8_9PEZI|nr:hypothetical protein LTR62_005641 [Meristemomyces frigidus]
MFLTMLGTLLIPVATWFYMVASIVKDPYLDEVFHVRQAQHYCNARFDIWDPKITTPPGLYILSDLGSKLPFISCDINALRGLNVLGIVLLGVVARHSYSKRFTAHGRSLPSIFDHSALNIALFPPLFFFSALYYTDIWSTLLVVTFYTQLPLGNQHGGDHGTQSMKLVALGLASLMFRQTNIFWVAIFPAALVTMQQLDQGHQAVKDSMYREVPGFGDSWYNVVKTSYKMQVIYDPPIKDAFLESYLATLVSMIACALKLITQPKKVVSLLLMLAPYLTLLTTFAGFVLWNRSVVLGDKSNHTATLHLPQMLYIWPFITFFSWPVLYPYLLLTPISIISWLSLPLSSLETLQIVRRGKLLPRTSIALLAVSLACLIVYANTIVHPFTLADNRHYVFYIFKLLLRPWWMRYAVAPLYVICGWASIQALGGGPSKGRRSSDTAKATTLPDGQHSATVGFALIWIATSALQLITAPLVEPRYFILPWVFWRMHLPLQVPYTEGASTKPEGQALRQALVADYDHRVWIETAWMFIMNAATGFIFLYWSFAWPQEPGEVQRFMW